MSSNGMNINQIINNVLENSNWFWPYDYEFLQSISRQLNISKELSDKQSKVIHKMYKRFVNNQQPRFVSGGTPGLGRRR